MTMRRSHRLLVLTLASIFAPGLNSGADVQVSGEWIRLGDVAPVSGVAADRHIAASPLPGQRMPLSSAFIEAQASAAGFPVDLPDGEMVWITRVAAKMPAQPITPPPQMPKRAAAYDVRDGEIPVLNTDLRRGDEITPDMISYEAMPDGRRIQGLIRSANVLKETEARRTIRAGEPISLSDVQPISVVKKGDLIQLIYERGPIKLAVSAKALNDAARGEAVRLQNLQSNRSMDAIAWGPGEARVNSPMTSREG